MEDLLVGISIYAIPVLLAITVHEFSHGYVAYKLGDPTAKMMGRLTLNPLAHIELFGTVILPIMLVLIKSPFMIAWAKPVPINPMNFKRPYRDMALSSLAGPASNFVMCIIFLLLYKAAVQPDASILGNNQELFAKMSRAGFYINFALFAFNLLPIPPLDGSKVLMGFLPAEFRRMIEKIEPYGFMIIMLLIVLKFFETYMAFMFRIFIYIFGGLFL
jgi:Zn-dependent protease